MAVIDFEDGMVGVTLDQRLEFVGMDEIVLPEIIPSYLTGWIYVDKKGMSHGSTSSPTTLLNKCKNYLSEEGVTRINDLFNQRMMVNVYIDPDNMEKTLAQTVWDVERGACKMLKALNDGGTEDTTFVFRMYTDPFTQFGATLDTPMDDFLEENGIQNAGEVNEAYQEMIGSLRTYLGEKEPFIGYSLIINGENNIGWGDKEKEVTEMHYKHQGGAQIIDFHQGRSMPKEVAEAFNSGEAEERYDAMKLKTIHFVVDGDTIYKRIGNDDNDNTVQLCKNARGIIQEYVDSEQEHIARIGRMANAMRGTLETFMMGWDRKDEDSNLHLLIGPKLGFSRTDDPEEQYHDGVIGRIDENGVISVPLCVDNNTSKKDYGLRCWHHLVDLKFTPLND